MSKDAVGELVKKLDIIIKLQAVGLSDRHQTAKDKIIFLSSAGLQPKFIAEVLGTSPNFVNVTLSKLRKAKKGQAKPDGALKDAADD